MFLSAFRNNVEKTKRKKYETQFVIHYIEVKAQKNLRLTCKMKTLSNEKGKYFNLIKD